MRIRISDVAWNDARGIHEHYESERHGLGAKFCRALGYAIEDILEQPMAWSPVRGGYRKRNTRRFPYSVIYYIHGDTAVITAVVHQSRRPGSWKKRDQR